MNIHMQPYTQFPNTVILLGVSLQLACKREKKTQQRRKERNKQSCPHQERKKSYNTQKNIKVTESTQTVVDQEMAERDLNFKETELCLGLPGGGETPKATGKRGFAETVDLKLNLQAKAGAMDLNENLKNASKDKNHMKDLAKPPAKAQVVGWPPVRSYRKNIMAQKNSSEEGEKASSGNGSAAFVKVCMDGAPYLRKVDLKMYTSYQQLSDALAKMFSSFTMGNYGAQGMIDFMNESKLMDLLNSSEYVPTYEDKDGDWMLVGDVPWEMFVDSCKRLRIMKGSEAIGLAPRAMEKCKSRS